MKQAIVTERLLAVGDWGMLQPPASSAQKAVPAPMAAIHRVHGGNISLAARQHFV
jgi:hypothetical protein